MKLDLHLGVHRTGTTALQQACRNNAAALAASGGEVWGPDVMRAAPLQRFPNIFAAAAAGEDKQAAVEQTIATLHDAIQERIDGGLAHLLVTEENLLGSMRLNLETQTLYPKARARMTAYGALFPQAPDRIFVSLRSYAGYWASSYAFAALRNDLPPFADLHRGLVDGSHGWLDLLADLRQVFPDSRVIVWQHTKTEPALRAVLDTMFGAVTRTFDLPRNLTNRALSGAALEAALQLRSDDPGLSAKQLQEAVTELNKAGSAPFQPFTAQEVQALNARFADELAHIASGAIAGVELRQPSVAIV